jgi:hypothetical protein
VIDPAAALVDGLYLTYRVEGSTGPGETRSASERWTFRARPDGRFVAELEAEAVPQDLYVAAYGDPIVIDAGFAATSGRPLQFRGLCPLHLAASSRTAGATVAWPWDGAGVEPMPNEPEQQLLVHAAVRGPVVFRHWSAWLLEPVGMPPGAAPLAYYEADSGLLVGVEYGVDLPGSGRFVYCDAELVDRGVERWAAAG